MCFPSRSTCLRCATFVMLAGGSIIGGTARSTYADDKVTLLSAVDTATTDLSEKQALRLDLLKNRMTTKDKNVRVVKMQSVSAVGAGAQLALDVPHPMTLNDYNVSRFTEGTGLTWRASGEPDSVSLGWTPGGAACAGLIYSGSNVYEVTPLGGGLQALVQLDQSKFHDDHPKAFDDISKALAAKLPETKAPPSADAPPTEITVLVAYTPRVAGLATDVQALINGAVAVANSTYANSKVRINLKLVKSVRVNYTESATHDEDLQHFRVKDDGMMDEIHGLRDDVKADVCVLLIDNDQYCGLAAAILATADTAFAVVHYECAVGNLSFAHEIGHLQGARHDLGVDPLIDPTYPWNHGYLIPTTDGRTVMAYPVASNPTRIPFWSNPDVEYRGVPTGTVDKQNNALMLNTSAIYISNFR